MFSKVQRHTPKLVAIAAALLALAVLLLPGTVLAQGVLITGFEGTGLAEGTSLTTQIPGLVITGAILVKAGNPRFSFFTGLGEADIAPDGAPFGGDFLAGMGVSTTVTIDFATPVSNLAFSLADIDGNELLTLEAIDAFGTVLETFLFETGDPDTGDAFATSVQFTAIDIKRLVITPDRPALYGVDNLTAAAWDVEDVEIDIKPGSFPNSINIGANGVIPIAIFSSPEFDAIQVDPQSVVLGGLGVAVRGNGNKLLASVEDVNGDGLNDLSLKIETQNLAPGQFQDGFATLTGVTFGGQAIRGSDTIVIVPLE